MYEYKAKVLRWIDGDTLLVEVDLGFYVKKEEKVRLARINAPELTADVPYQLRLAKSARAKAKKFCPEGSLVVLQAQKERRDRYARYLAEVVHDGENLSDYLLEIGAAKPWK